MDLSYKLKLYRLAINGDIDGLRCMDGGIHHQQSTQDRTETQCCTLKDAFLLSENRVQPLPKIATFSLKFKTSF